MPDRLTGRTVDFESAGGGSTPPPAVPAWAGEALILLNGRVIFTALFGDLLPVISSLEKP